jgi:predicted adenine nucleotide alpha hydrolase (AANH) superfamily ATPase
MKGFDVTGFFYKNNIHPYTECIKRQEVLTSFAESIDLRVIYQKGYDLEGFIQTIVFRESRQSAASSTTFQQRFYIASSKIMNSSYP